MFPVPESLHPHIWRAKNEQLNAIVHLKKICTYKYLGSSCFDDACQAKMYNAQIQMSLETQQGNGYFALKCD